MSKTFFVSGGGTGGHIYPAVAVALELVKHGHKVYFIGNPNNMEYEIVGKCDGITFLPVSVKGMPRKAGFGFLKWLWGLECSLWKVLGYMLKYKPDAVFTTGGYVSAPAAYIAGLMKKPLMIHDCDAVPGLVSRTAAPFADCVSVAFEESKSLLNAKKVVCTGNPVRTEFLTVSKSEARAKTGLRDKFTVMVTGGSQGAKTLNRAAIEAAQAIVERMDVQLVVQTGKKNYDAFIAEISEYFPNYYMNTNLVIKPYFDEMFYALKSADIVVSRAGSLSLSELNLCKAACLLVPYPYAAADHQTKNAKRAVSEGFAVMYEDKDFTGDVLSRAIEYYSQNRTEVEKMSEASFKNAKPDAKREIVEILENLAK